MQEHKKIILISVALIIISGFAVYANSLDGEFIWDDYYLIRDNQYIKHFSDIPKIFTQNIRAGGGMKCSAYRPMQMLTYMIDYSLWKLDVRGYHLTNILLHILAALSIYWLSSVIFKDKALSLIVSLFFVVHPIHTNAVSYMSGRADPLALVFMLLCFVFYIKSIHSKGVFIYVLMPLSYIFALLSRENSLILPVLLLLYHYAFKIKLKARQFLPIASIALIYILIRITSLRHLLPTVMYPDASTFPQRIPGFFVAVSNYIRLLFLPFNLHMEYGLKLFSPAEPRAIAGVVILLSSLIFVFKKRNSGRLVFFSACWFFATLLPVSNLYLINAYMAEHWLYLPSIGFFLIAAKGLASIYRVKNLGIIAIILTVGLLAFYSSLTVRQNGYWKDSLAFNERTLKYAPDSFKAYNSLGLAYNRMGRKQRAIEAYKKAVELNPTYALTYNNLGIIYRSLGRSAEAIDLYKKAIELNPNYAEAHSNLGNAYNEIGRRQQALASYKKAIELNPNHAGAYNNIGNLYNNLGRKKEAIASFKKAIELNPNYVQAHINLAIVYYNSRQYGPAVKHCDRAVELGYKAGPEFLEALKPHRK